MYLFCTKIRSCSQTEVIYSQIWFSSFALQFGCLKTFLKYKIVLKQWTSAKNSMAAAINFTLKYRKIGNFKTITLGWSYPILEKNFWILKWKLFKKIFNLNSSLVYVCLVITLLLLKIVKLARFYCFFEMCSFCISSFYISEHIYIDIMKC